MNYGRAKKHYEALLEAAEYYRLLGLLAKKRTLHNWIRAEHQKSKAIFAMKEALHG